MVAMACGHLPAVPGGLLKLKLVRLDGLKSGV